MKDIGGFFELELDEKEEYHKNSIKLNTGRNAFEYILRANQYTKVYLPFYICNSMLEPLRKLNLPFEFYSIDHTFWPIFDFESLEENELFLYVNYFGVYDKHVSRIAGLSKTLDFNLCIDNTQSFFSQPINDIDTFYSARKFFGVPDGAYLYTNVMLDDVFERETGYDKFDHLIKRIDLGSNQAYESFRKNSEKHINQPIKKMSYLSEKILKSIDYTKVMAKRQENFRYIHSELKKHNEIVFDSKDIKSPLVYPFYSSKLKNMRHEFISKRVYLARYWQDVLARVDKESVEYNFALNLLPIPIDQRYGKEEMDYIISIFNKLLKE